MGRRRKRWKRDGRQEMGRGGEGERGGGSGRGKAVVHASLRQASEPSSGPHP